MTFSLLFFLISYFCTFNAQVHDILIDSIKSELLSYKPESHGGYAGVYWTLPRRNHDGVFIRNGSDPFYLILGGRNGQNIEVYKIKDRTSRLYATNHSLLHINHFNIIPIKPMSLNSEVDFFIPCGFFGHDVDKETEITHARVISWRPSRSGQEDEFSIRLGPRINPAVGGCASLSIASTENTFPDIACMFGGSSGSHDNGIFWNSSRCFDVNKLRWFKLPDIPVTHDHGNAGIIKRGICKKEDPEKIVVMGFRTYSYGESPGAVYALDVYRDDKGTSTGFGKSWYSLNSNDNSSYVLKKHRSAAGVIFAAQGRYIFLFGGIVHSNVTRQETEELMHQINAFDTCRGIWMAKPIGRFSTGRFAIQTQSTQDIFPFQNNQSSKYKISGDDNEHYAINCGGATIVTKHRNNPLIYDPKSYNVRDCEIHSIGALLNAARNESSRIESIKYRD